VSRVSAHEPRHAWVLPPTPSFHARASARLAGASPGWPGIGRLQRPSPLRRGSWGRPRRSIRPPDRQGFVSATPPSTPGAAATVRSGRFEGAFSTEALGVTVSASVLARADEVIE
jgi:hypothetical protein